jgi:hypothetical protein
MQNFIINRIKDLIKLNISNVIQCIFRKKTEVENIKKELYKDIVNILSYKFSRIDSEILKKFNKENIFDKIINSFIEFSYYERRVKIECEISKLREFSLKLKSFDKNIINNLNEFINYLEYLKSKYKI